MASPRTPASGPNQVQRTLGRVRLPGVAVVALGLFACSEARRGIGDNCDGPEQCASGLCYYGQCLDPEGDDDNDGLTNAREAGLGSDPFNNDTDGDGIADRDELGPSFEAIDTDGDGKPDIIESIRLDADGDCIVDQLDADDATPNDDLTPMVALVCSFEGICGIQRDRLRARCPDGSTAVCSYDGIDGWSEAEVACDGRDENCDGRVDEGFPDRNGDGVADCGPEPVQMKPFLGVVSGAGDGRNQQYRARLVVGSPVAGGGDGQGGKVRIGASPTETLGTETTEVP